MRRSLGEIQKETEALDMQAKALKEVTSYNQKLRITTTPMLGI